ncbi:MAG: AI-2E family transporter [Thermodesulfobacteriota bacterium]
MNVLREWFHRHLSDPQVVILALILLGCVLLIVTVGNLIAPVLASLVLAYLLEGVVRFLERYRVPRLLAVLVVFLLFVVLLFFLVLGLLPLLSQQIVQFFQELPSMLAAGQRELMRLPERYPKFITEEQVLDVVAALKSQLTGLGQRVLSISWASVRSLFNLLVYMILMPIMVFFFLKDKAKLLNYIKNFMPKDYTLTRQVWHDVDRQIGNFVRGKVWEIIIVWGAAYALFLALNLNYAILLSFLVGLSVIVPYVGATVMTLPVALVAYFQWGWGQEFIYALIGYTILQLLDGNLLVPLLLSEVVNLHPVAIIVAILFFGGIWGFWGVFFAIPLATLVQSVVNAWPRKPLPPQPE